MAYRTFECTDYFLEAYPELVSATLHASIDIWEGSVSGELRTETEIEADATFHHVELVFEGLNNCIEIGRETTIAFLSPSGFAQLMEDFTQSEIERWSNV